MNVIGYMSVATHGTSYKIGLLFFFFKGTVKLT